MDCFNVSSEALVAESLFDAYRAADEAAIKKLILSKPIFTELDNQVSVQLCHYALCTVRNKVKFRSSIRVQSKLE